MILDEGKRDNQLLPFLEIYSQKTGNNISLGEFKTMMQRKLSTEGGIRNISLQSNYYLVGAVKYYFQGQLTVNQDLSIFKDANNTDNWNIPVCKKLNALILVLRNGFIDSIGTTWVEPEDLGEMSLPDLFKKYRKEINKVLAKEKYNTASDTEPVEEFKDYVMPNSEYTYDIIYGFGDSSKYEEATSPGSWCITYGKSHLDYYTSRGNGHFVIFKKNGFEKIPRQKQEEMWKGDKPQDEYGNSLIAYLQDNNSPGPANYGGAPLITSRWNHGYEFLCEADRAYTQKEFQKITGVTDKDLEGIYNTWKHNAPERGYSDGEKTKASLKLTPEELRDLKYIQMRINGGENPALLMSDYVTGKSYSICKAEVGPNNTTAAFLIVGKKILFETAMPEYNQIFFDGDSADNVLTFFQFYKTKKYCILNKRLKSLVNIGGTWLFKATFHNAKPNMLIQVKLSNTDIALIDSSNGNPIRLPNGQYWFNAISSYHVQSELHGKVKARVLPKDTIYELTYDLSSGEKYYYDSTKGVFYDIGQTRDFHIFRNTNIGPGFLPIIITNNRNIDYYIPRGIGIQKLYYNGKPFECVFNLDGQLYKLGDVGPEDAIKVEFHDIYQNSKNGYVVLNMATDGRHMDYRTILNVKEGTILLLPDGQTPVKIPDNICRWNSIRTDDDIVIFPATRNTSYMYNIKFKRYYKNPFNYPSNITWEIDVNSLGRGNHYVEFYSRKVVSWMDRPDRDWDNYWKDREDATRYLDTKTQTIYKEITDDNDKSHYHEVGKLELNEVRAIVKTVLNEILKHREKELLKLNESDAHLYEGLIFEGKRDNQLLPYLEFFNEKTGQNMSLGEFKTMMLRKLANEGPFSNLSLASNYYLVGAVKYYFNGDLTDNSNLSIFEGGTDNWNEGVCTRLNTLINILRNSYIDTVGQTWEQPEDFGNLSALKLLKKYEKKINKELNIKPEQEKEQLNRNEHVGNGYTYEIMYSYEDCKKYNTYTRPGAWCITYAQQHYNNYVRNLKIHYVIFKKDGFENVKRAPQKEKWVVRNGKNCPQDDYGNSLIALLQSNSSWKPVYITSRWNHGYEFSCEADHAYTTEEFMKITGVSQKDLENIYKIWKQDKETKSSTSDIKADKLSAIRRLKYYQMLINGGNNDILKQLYLSLNLDYPELDSNIGKAKFFAKIKENDKSFYVFVANRKIFFDTLSTKLFQWDDYYGLKMITVRVTDRQKKYAFWNPRTNELLNIEGCTLFTNCSMSYRESPAAFLELVKGPHESCIVSTSTFKPLTLPNGAIWFDNVITDQEEEYTRNYGLYLDANSLALRFVYDPSSKEAFFYDIQANKFLKNPDTNSYSWTSEYTFGTCVNDNYLARNDCYFIRYCHRTDINMALSASLNSKKSYYMMFKNGQIKELPTADGGMATKLSGIKIHDGSGILAYAPLYGKTRRAYLLYDFKRKRFIMNPINEEEKLLATYSYKTDTPLLRIWLQEGHDELLYNSITGKFLENPFDKGASRFVFYGLSVERWGQPNEGITLFMYVDKNPKKMHRMVVNNENAKIEMLSDKPISMY